jgi:predicted CXXCH cytochrome family protein
MKSIKRIRIEFGKYVVLVLGTLCFGFVGCVAPAPPKPAPEEDIPALYTSEAQLIKPEECGRCHPRFYYFIKTEGGKHRIDCKLCHVQFHVHFPGKVEYQEILPKCSACHEQVHGADLAQCSGCHTNAHTPMKIPAERALEQGCFICHAEVDKEMKTFVTQHTELYCSSCHHTSHRYVPECLECHRPHTEGMTQAECLTCHAPHKARQVAYPEDIRREACSGCHRDAYDKLEQSGTIHSGFSCAKCHPEHRAIKRCRECHPDPHPDRPGLLQKYPACGRCHGVAHNVTGGS